MKEADQLPGFEILNGVGIGYNFTHNWAVKAEWERFNKVGGGDIGKSDIDNTSVSVAYKF